MPRFRAPGVKPNHHESRFNPAHPLAQGLAGLWLPVAVTVPNLVGNGNTLAPNGTVSIGDTRGGPGLASESNGAGGVLAAPTAALKPSRAVTVWWRGAITGGGSTAGNPTFAGMAYDNADGSPYYAYGLHRSATGPGYVLFTWNNGAFQSLNIAGLIDTAAYGKIADIALTIDGGTARAYFNGREVGNSTSVGTIGYGATAEFLVGVHPTSSTSYAGARAVAVGVWSRALTAGEIAALAADPYTLLARRRGAFKAAATGGTGTLSGAGTTPAPTGGGAGFQVAGPTVALFGAGEAPPPTGSGSGLTFATPTVALSGAGTAPTPTGAGAGLTFAPPVYTLSGAGEAPAPTGTGAGFQYGIPTGVLSGAGIAPAPLGSGAGLAYAPGTFILSGAGIAPPPFGSNPGAGGGGRRPYVDYLYGFPRER